MTMQPKGKTEQREAKSQMNKTSLLDIMQSKKNRTIYESGDERGRATGRFHVDFATYPGGSTEEVPRALIDELEKAGIIERAFPEGPHINAWKLSTGESNHG